MSKKYFQLDRNDDVAELVIYGDVYSFGRNSAENLSAQLQDLDVSQINVQINSYGGEVAEGLAIYNALKRHPAKVKTVCDGFACSIASVIFAAGDSRIMCDSSLLMIHNAWTWTEGDAAALRKQADDLDKITEASVKAYMTIAKCDEAKIRELMNAETWINPEEAVELGLATGIRTYKTDRPSQSVRKEVFAMIRNPYQLDEETDDTDSTDETDGAEVTYTDDESGADTSDGGTETDETDTDTDGNADETEDETDTTDETDEADKQEAEDGTDDGVEDPDAMQYAFFRAIAKM